MIKVKLTIKKQKQSEVSVRLNDNVLEGLEGDAVQDFVTRLYLTKPTLFREESSRTVEDLEVIKCSSDQVPSAKVRKDEDEDEDDLDDEEGEDDD